jgi:hypothetical protein
VPITVLAGPDRIATSIVTSQNGFGAHTAHGVVLARSDGFADALSGTPLAVAKNAPLLLNPTTALDARVETEVKRVLNAGGTVYLLGGESALSASVANALMADGFTVVRLGGVNRFATAADIAAALGAPATVLLATGMTPADALVAGAAAAKVSGIVLLTANGVMPPETQAVLSAAKGATVYAVGGPAAAAGPAALPLVGGNRYATGVTVAKAFFGTPAAVGLASGLSYADALAGGAHIGLHGGPLVLVDPTAMDPTVHAYLASIGAGVSAAFAYGGSAVLPPATISALSAAFAGA